MSHTQTTGAVGAVVAFDRATSPLTPPGRVEEAPPGGRYGLPGAVPGGAPRAPATRRVAPPRDFEESWGWLRRAACLGMDTGLFFGPDGEREAARNVREAEALGVCCRCPVQAECLAAATKEGVWGGTTEDERKNGNRRPHRRKAVA